MATESKGYKIVLFTIFTLSVFTIAILEVSHISNFDWWRLNHKGDEGYFYSNERDGVAYRGEIYAEHLKTRDQIVAEMARTTMQFYETKYSFGAVPVRNVVKHSFRFKNTGQFPLMIAKTDVSCGCTVPEFPQDAISPGSDGEINVVYTAAGNGLQQKNILIHANTNPETISIGIEADVR